MSRGLVHDLRLYYKSRRVFAERLATPRAALALPFMPKDRAVALPLVSGRTLRMRAGLWRLVPSACRLDAIGAEVELLEDAKRVRIAGYTVYSPHTTRAEAQYYREVFLDDCYGLAERDLTGQVVVDIGAYVGDTALAFAARGATVHAVEPSQACATCIGRNAEANGFGERIVVHPVGLAERAEQVEYQGEQLELVEGIGYTLQRLPAGVDILKIDCEGAEYYLLADPRFLGHLRPREIRLEYHRGPDAVMRHLADAGYDAEIISRESNGNVGLIRATARSAVTA